jgi:hypothetical protein
LAPVGIPAVTTATATGWPERPAHIARLQTKAGSTASFRNEASNTSLRTRLPTKPGNEAPRQNRTIGAPACSRIDRNPCSTRGTDIAKPCHSSATNRDDNRVAPQSARRTAQGAAQAGTARRARLDQHRRERQQEDRCSAMMPSRDESAASANEAAMIGMPIITVLPYAAFRPSIPALAKSAPRRLAPSHRDCVHDKTRAEIDGPKLQHIEARRLGH